jgi:hypothetical protein
MIKWGLIRRLLRAKPSQRSDFKFDLLIAKSGNGCLALRSSNCPNKKDIHSDVQIPCHPLSLTRFCWGRNRVKERENLLNGRNKK